MQPPCYPLTRKQPICPANSLVCSERQFENERMLGVKTILSILCAHKSSGKYFRLCSSLIPLVELLKCITCSASRKYSMPVTQTPIVALSSRAPLSITSTKCLSQIFSLVNTNTLKVFSLLFLSHLVTQLSSLLPLFRHLVKHFFSNLHRIDPCRNTTIGGAM